MALLGIVYPLYTQQIKCGLLSKYKEAFTLYMFRGWGNYANPTLMPQKILNGIKAIVCVFIHSIELSFVIYSTFQHSFLL